MFLKLFIRFYWIRRIAKNTLNELNSLSVIKWGSFTPPKFSYVNSDFLLCFSNLGGSSSKRVPLSAHSTIHFFPMFFSFFLKLYQSLDLMIVDRYWSVNYFLKKGKIMQKKYKSLDVLHLTVDVRMETHAMKNRGKNPLPSYAITFQLCEEKVAQLGILWLCVQLKATFAYINPHTFHFPWLFNNLCSPAIKKGPLQITTTMVKYMEFIS